ncbi:MAG: hypothetical protein GY714_29630 [Desulfobacterales bacterium]|nr:hypothetical protein [Desulfobacterales bacterium]
MKFKNRILQALIIIFASLFFTNTYASDLVGKTPGEFKVSSGASTYNIPIVVPPGIAGMQPNLSINYNSNSGNSLLGRGFNLSGITAITRCGQTFAQDGKKTGVNYTSTDRFMIGGSRLIAVSGAYGADGTEYRTEIDQYSKIVSYGTAPGGGPLYFKVWTKQRMVLELGGNNTNDNSRIEAADKDVVRIWNLNKISNKFSTSVNYTYNEDDATGEHSLSKIEYANNSVEFVYEDRNDKRSFYQAGSKISITKRLKSIQTKSDNILVRDYKLTYTEQGEIKTSLLTSVQEFDGLGQALPEIKFEWNAVESVKFGTFELYPSGEGTHSNNYIEGSDTNGIYSDLIDMNGDGLPDRVGNENHSTGDKGLHVALNNGNGFGEFELWPGAEGSHPDSYVQGSDSTGTYSDIIDMNGDGLPDRVGHFNFKTNQYGLWVALNTGSGFGEYTLWMSKDAGQRPNCYIRGSDSTGTYSGIIDMNGDSLPDRVGHFNFKKEKYGLWVALNTGSGFDEYTLWMSKDAGQKTNCYIRGSDSNGTYSDIIDMNGDGLPDRVGSENYNSTVKGFHIALNNSYKPLLKSIISQINTTNITKIDIEYKPLTDTTIYTKTDSSSEYPVLDFQPSWRAVSSVKIDNGIGGQNEITYTYGGAKIDVKGRGFLGFEWIEVKDEATQKTKKTTYKQTFPYIGLPLSEEIKLSNGNLISKTENEYDKKEAEAGKITLDDGTVFTKYRYSIYKSKSIQNSFDLDATHLKTVTVENSNMDDYGNIGTSKVTTTDGSLTFLKETSRTFSNDDSTWNIGKETGETVTFTNPDLTSTIKLSSRTFYPDTGAVLTETVEPGNALAVTNTYIYDDYGNIQSTTLTGSGVEDRTTTFTMDASNRFVEKVTNALGHMETREYDGRFGVETKYIGPNNLTTTWAYDSLGRKIKENRADGSETTWTYGWSDCENGIYSVTEQTVGLPSQTKHFDSKGREIRVEGLGFNGKKIYIDQIYNNIGQLAKSSMPYFKDDEIYYTEFTYDELDRKTEVNKATLIKDTFLTTKYAYSGFSVTSTNPLSQTRKTITNAVGKIIRVEEELSAWADYTYDPVGNLIKTDVNGIITTITYDKFGNKTGMNDPDMGIWEYKYNTFGELTEEKDAKGQTVKKTYDKLGRLVAREDHLEGVSNWVYDTAAKGIGKIAELKRSLEYLKTFTYDAVGRPYETTTNINSESFSVKTYYDGYSRIRKVIQPQNFNVEYVYNVNGYLAAIRSPESSIYDYDWKFLEFLLNTAHQSVESATAAAIQAQEKATYYNDKATYYEGLGAQSPDMPQELKDELLATSAKLRKAEEILEEEYQTCTKLADDLKTVSTQLAQQKEIISQRLENANINENMSELTEMATASDYSYFWIAKDRDAAGRLSEYVYGNGLGTEKNYDPATGHLKTIKSNFGFGGDHDIRSLEYEYDELNNVKARYDYIQKMTEEFTYDSLNRLTLSDTKGEIDSKIYYKTSVFKYDVAGNMTYNSNVGNYYYGDPKVNAGPHALTGTVTDGGYSYDKNGNMISGGGKTVQWASFNKPTKFIKGTNTVEFTYGPEYDRYKKKEVTDGKTTETIYIDKVYEKITEGNKTTHKYFMYAEGHLATIHVKTFEDTTQLPDETRYMHYDPLGSVDTITDNRGNIVERMSYEAFGKRREGNWQSNTGTVISAFTNRGYTGHEHIDSMDIIHMNGRVYDPELGRFLSADPFIQDPYNTQSFNRYSYCMNNPFKYTDPSGYDPDDGGCGEAPAGPSTGGSPYGGYSGGGGDHDYDVYSNYEFGLTDEEHEQLNFQHEIDMTIVDAETYLVNSMFEDQMNTNINSIVGGKKSDSLWSKTKNLYNKYTSHKYYEIISNYVAIAGGLIEVYGGVGLMMTGGGLLPGGFLTAQGLVTIGTSIANLKNINNNVSKRYINTGIFGLASELTDNTTLKKAAIIADIGSSWKFSQIGKLNAINSAKASLNTKKGLQFESMARTSGFNMSVRSAQNSSIAIKSINGLDRAFSMQPLF